MIDRDKGCIGICARDACIVFGLEDLNTGTIALVAIIKRNFEELGI